MSNKLPFFQFFPLDWLADTTILSNEAKGAYIDILCQLWLSETPGQRTWYKKEFTNMLRLFEHEHDVEGPIYELASVCELYCRDNDDNISDFENCATVTIVSRRMTRDWLKLSKLKSKHKKYNDQRTTKQRPDNDRKTTNRSQKSEVRSHIKSNTPAPPTPVDKSPELSKKNSQIEEIFKVAKAIAGTDTARGRELCTFVAKTVKEGTAFGDSEEVINEAILWTLNQLKSKAVREGHQIEKILLWPYLQKTYKFKRTKALETESDRYKREPMQQASTILERVMKGHP